eukprot:s8326_g3.t1
MSDTAAADPELEELIIRLGCLEVRVRGRGLQTAAEVEDSGFVVVGPTRVAPIGPEASGEDWDTLETRVLAATSPNELAGLNILELAPLARQLRASVQGWSPLARVGRAYRAGVSHRAILRGDFGRAVSSPTCPIRNTLYIALRCRSHLQGFWTSDLGAFLARVKECDHVHRRRSRSWRARSLLLDHFLILLGDEEHGPARLAQGVLVRVRAGGFLVALPSVDPVVEVMRGLVDGEGESLVLDTVVSVMRGLVDGEGESLVLDTVVSVAFETSRGRALGEGPSYLADVPWEGA